MTWNNLPERMRERAEHFWQIHEGKSGYRFARFENHMGRPVDVIDPVWLSKTPGSWKVVRLYPEHPEYEAHRLAQALQTRKLWKWHFEPGCFEGETLHILGNGPSARQFSGDIPGRVMAINGAIELTRPDFWFCADSGLVGGEEWVARMVAQDVAGVNCIFSSESPAELVFSGQDRAATCNTFLFSCSPPTQFCQHIVPIGSRLPLFSVGRQTLIPALHCAFWLGFSEIHLWGVDQGCVVKPESIEDYHTGAAVSSNRALLDKDWYQIPGVDGLLWTNDDMLASGKAVDAMCLWLQDFGIRVHNRSAGVRFDFAEKQEQSEPETVGV